MKAKQPIDKAIWMLLFATTVMATRCIAQTDAMTEKDFAMLTFLEGEWVRQGTPPDREGYEYWAIASETELQGAGISIRKGDTLFVEKLRLVLKEGTISYVADVAENQAPVWFTVTAIDKSGFTSENPAHDFPKKITYRLEGETLRAQISGDGKTFTYVFKRKE